jgi:two-component system, NtrC family, nitrogen regulation sensor histidine kinase NtrY
LDEAAAAQNRAALTRLLRREVSDPSSESIMFFGSQGNLLASAGSVQLSAPSIRKLLPARSFDNLPARGISAKKKFENEELFLSVKTLRSSAGEPLGSIVAVTRLPLNIAQIAREIQTEAQKYDQLSRQRKAVKRTYLLSLFLLTVLIVFAATWFALFLSKQVTVPIQALAEAMHEVSKGNLAYRIEARAGDELGVLIRSFNAMTQELQENRLALERAAQDVQKANRELEERGNIMAAILENIPTGVVSFNPQGRVVRFNSTAEHMFGSQQINAARRLTDLFSPDRARDVTRLLRLASRHGVVTRQMELELGGKQAFVALTLSVIRAQHGAVGSLLVLEDMTELLRAQKALVWQEVAQHIAHEIKNPLTPIQLSAERIRRWVERNRGRLSNQDLMEAVDQSASLIECEVATLKTLVDEFSNFARFPESRPVPAHLNAIVEKALGVFDGRLNGIVLHRDLANGLPAVHADPEQIKRALVNLVDNAAEALEHSIIKEIWVHTALDDGHDVVRLVVADTGPGIPPNAKERLFLPFFSTKRGGSGLGLAIVSRIIAEHNGVIRVEENRPLGTQFIIELPVERSPEETAKAQGSG